MTLNKFELKSQIYDIADHIENSFNRQITIFFFLKVEIMQREENINLIRF